MKNKSKGISLIALIITIIVIIILAAIVITRAGSVIDNANFAKFTSEFDDYNTAVQQDYARRYTKYVTTGKHITMPQIYYMIASGTELNEYEDPVAAGLVSELPFSLSPDGLSGTEYYEITSDTNISDWSKQKSFYDPSEKHYVTDMGEVFVLPGYGIKADATWYISSSKHYASVNGIKGPISIEVSSAKITTDLAGNTNAGTEIEDGTTLYISFTASLEGESVTITPSVPYAITTNGTYTFEITGGGKTVNKTVEVSNYKVPSLADILQVGHYVEYDGDATEAYATNTNNTGHSSSQNIEKETKNWRVLYKEGDTVYITPQDGVNMTNKVYLSGWKGYYRGPTELNNICAALYSNSELGTTARSMTVEDVNKACNYTPSFTNATRYAYYPYGTDITTEPTIEHGGKTYTKKACSNSFSGGFTAHRFYVNSAEPITAIECANTLQTDANGFKYYEPTAANPVFVTKTYYSYTPSSKNSTVGNILGSSSGWLASPCVYVSDTNAGFRVRYVYSSGLHYGYVAGSGGDTHGNSLGVRPVVSLSSTLQIDTNAEGRDGTTAEKAWKLKKI